MLGYKLDFNCCANKDNGFCRDSHNYINTGRDNNEAKLKEKQRSKRPRPSKGVTSNTVKPEAQKPALNNFTLPSIPKGEDS